MTMLPIISIFLLLTILPTTFSAATCTTKNTLYAQCTVLPALNATLHYTYTSSNSTLSISFTATPPNPSGWVAWGINPIAKGMAGTQAFVAGKSSSHDIVSVSTYNLSSYGDIIPGDLSFPVYSKRAEFNSDGSITIFAVVKTDSQKVNHVWQVGPGFNKGFPKMHETKAENLASKLTVDLSMDASSSGSGSGKVTSPTSNGVSLMNKMNVGLFGFLSFILFLFFST